MEIQGREIFVKWFFACMAFFSFCCMITPLESGNGKFAFVMGSFTLIFCWLAVLSHDEDIERRYEE
jgi:hypothetical protein